MTTNRTLNLLFNTPEELVGFTEPSTAHYNFVHLAATNWIAVLNEVFGRKGIGRLHNTPVCIGGCKEARTLNEPSLPDSLGKEYVGIETTIAWRKRGVEYLEAFDDCPTVIDSFHEITAGLALGPDLNNPFQLRWGGVRVNKETSGGNDSTVSRVSVILGIGVGKNDGIIFVSNAVRHVLDIVVAADLRSKLGMAKSELNRTGKRFTHDEVVRTTDGKLCRFRSKGGENFED